jgi:hypothetical protein
VKDSPLSRDASDHEMRLVAAFFGNIKVYFVGVGANDPRERAPTWHLEQAHWTGILIEPQPGLARETARPPQSEYLRSCLFLA